MYAKARSDQKLRVLGEDTWGITLSKPITVIADKFLQSASKAIEQAGGKAVLLLDKLQEQ
jgi:ribosomal protein L18E